MFPRLRGKKSLPVVATVVEFHFISSRLRGKYFFTKSFIENANLKNPVPARPSVPQSDTPAP